MVIANRVSIEDGIHAARTLLAKCKFDDRKCDKLIEALKQYRASWDPQKECYGAPIHDWASHYADAFRMLAVALRDEKLEHQPRQTEAIGADYNPLRIDDQAYRQQLEKPTRYNKLPVVETEYNEMAW